MFFAHEVAVGIGFDTSSVRLVDLMNRGALRGASGVAYEEGAAAVLRVGPFGDIRGFSKLVRVRFLDPVHSDGAMSVALRWEATGATGELFPVLDADLILAHDDGDQSRLAAVGSYRPPFGPAGAALDKVIMHRLATATIRSLLANVAEAITQPARGSQLTPALSPRQRPTIGPAMSE